jgi:predicted O-linked N-acetylglucosamine transferase (SPINDLY family)
LGRFRELLGQADISLDTFPYNGGTTSCETLWLGLPYVALKGESFAARMGYALLKELGLAELAAGSRDEYVDIAVALANDRERLRDLRSGMRARLEASSLGDAAGFTRRLEAAYEDMWAIFKRGTSASDANPDRSAS